MGSEVNKASASDAQLQQLVQGVRIDDSGKLARANSVHVLEHELVPRGNGAPGIAKKLRVEVREKIETSERKVLWKVETACLETKPLKANMLKTRKTATCVALFFFGL